jgi:hypothetical protein
VFDSQAKWQAWPSGAGARCQKDELSAAPADTPERGRTDQKEEKQIRRQTARIDAEWYTANAGMRTSFSPLLSSFRALLFCVAVKRFG